jgi:hypothetical protein
MSSPAPGEESVVKTIIVDNTTAAKRAAQRWDERNVPKK